MAKKQYSGVRESKPGRINDLGTTGKEVEEQFRKGCLKKADRTFAQGLQCQQINSMAALMSLEDAVFISHSPQGCVGCSIMAVDMFRVGQAHRGIKNIRNPRIIVSNVDQKSVVFGGEQKLREAVKKAVERYHPKLAFIYASCASGIIGDDIDAIGVTYGPGLVGALLVGVAEAKAIAYAKKKPLVGVHHIEGHVSANYIEHPDLEPPFLCEIISGGHTHLVIVKDYGSFEILGRTRDDAAGEAFDKVARAIGLGYPGGPKIDKLAKEGNPHAIDFPRAHMEDAPYDFSFSGVKSAVLNHLNKCRMIGEPIVEADIAASFQQAVVDVLVDNAIRAAKDYHMDRLAIAGGVASNGALRAAMEAACEKEGIRFYRPSPIFCTDNAAMIGVAAYYEYQKGTRHGWDLNAVPNLKLGER